MNRRRRPVALRFFALAVLAAPAALGACGTLVDIQPLTVAERDASNDDARDAAVFEDVGAPVDADAAPDVVCSTKTTPFLLPGTATERGDSPLLHWNGIDAIRFDDEAGASADDGNPLNSHSRVLVATGFAFVIPPSARILGVTVLVKARAANGGVWTDEAVGLEPHATAFTSLPQAQTYGAAQFEIRTYGGPEELWGLPLDPAFVSQPTFGIGFQAQRAPVSRNGALMVDSIKMQIRYASCE